MGDGCIDARSKENNSFVSKLNADVTTEVIMEHMERKTVFPILELDN